MFSILLIIRIPCTSGAPGRPEITGFTKPAMEGDVITLTCTTMGSKPAANIRWFRNDKEVQGEHVWISQTIVSSVTTYYHLLPYWRHINCQLVQMLHSSCAHIHALFHWPGSNGAKIHLAHSHHCCCCWKLSKYCRT